MSQPGEEPKQDRLRIRGFFAELVDRLKKNWHTAMVGAALVAGVGYILSDTVGISVVNWSYDVPFRVRGPIVPEEAAVVYIDEESHTALHQEYGVPWDRGLYAKLINILTQEHAKGVVFDVVMSGALRDPAANDALVRAITNNGKVVLAADLYIAGHGTVQSEVTEKFDPPYDAFYDAIGGDDRCGSDYIAPDGDQMIRRYLPCNPRNDMFASEAWAAALMVGAPITKNPAKKFVPFYINYYGPSGTILGASLSKVLTNSDLATNYFTDRVVFVGERLQTQYSGTRKDQYPTPFSYLTPNNPFSGGVEVHATAFLNLLRNERILRVPVKVELPCILIGGMLASLALTLLRPFPASLVALLLAFFTSWLNYYLFIHHHLWFAWGIVVLAQIPIALVFSVAVNSVQLYVEKQKVEQSLALYLSPKLVKQFAKDPTLLKPGARKQLLTILFSDIAGFTTISEGMDSDHLALSMNEYFQGAVQNCIFSTDGTVVKYIGDAIFAFWNAPELQGDHSYRACEAALLFRDQPVQYMNGKELITRIGLHTGVANVGNFGSMTRVDYTALGENINLAARMEGLNKYLGTRVLITDDTQKVAGPKIVTRYLGLFRLKGFEKAVGVYELSGRVEQEAESRELRERFAKALTVLATKDFTAAEAAFRHVLEISPKDGPSLFYLEQLEELRTETLPDDWRGEITLKDK